MCKRYFLSTMVIIVAHYSAAYGNNFSRVDNELNLINYSIRNFNADFFGGSSFKCVLPWNEKNIAIGDDYQVKDANDRTIVLSKVGPNSPTPDLIIKEHNFSRFRRSFTDGRSLHFDNYFPAKFFKIKTIDGIRDVQFYDHPGGNLLKVGSKAMSQLFYYAYRKETIGDRHYVLIGLESEEKKGDSIIGWVLYLDEGDERNMLLWNTNLGIRPVSSQSIKRKPYVFEATNRGRETARNYRSGGSIDDMNNLLVGDAGLAQYQARFNAHKEQISRWLPMYTVQDKPEYALEIGVLENAGQMREDALSLLSGDMLNVVFLVDATLSMGNIWENLGAVLKKVVDQSIGAKNIRGENVKIRSKVYYYHNEIVEVTGGKWIETKRDAEDHEYRIKSVKEKLKATSFRPNIYRGVQRVIADHPSTPMFLIVIGDAGDSTYNTSFDNVSALSQLSKQQLLVIKGIRFDSEFYKGSDAWENNGYEIEIEKAAYDAVYSIFGTNFDLINDIQYNKISNYQIDSMAISIGESIANMYNSILSQSLLTLGVGAGDANNKPVKTVFVQNYLNNFQSQIRQLGVGTFFEKGIVHVNDGYGSGEPLGNSIYIKDVLIDRETAEKMLNEINKYQSKRTATNFKRLARQIIGTFMQIEWRDIDEEFIENTELSRFWVSVVGDRDVASRIAPDLFASSVTFSIIFDNWQNSHSARERFDQNIATIQDYISRRIKADIGRYVSYDADQGALKYFWFEIDKLRFFSGLYN